MAADGLATQGARASATTILAKLNRNNSVAIHTRLIHTFQDKFNGAVAIITASVQQPWIIWANEAYKSHKNYDINQTKYNHTPWAYFVGYTV